MKKFILFASVLAGLFAAASCQQENLEPEMNGGVTYEITLPVGPQTKGELGHEKYDLHYEVYKTVNAVELETAPLLFEKTVEMVGNTKTITLDLLNDQDYTILFWANKQGTAHFDLENLRNVKVNTPIAANNDDRDAFCGKDQLVQHDGSQTKTVTLTRPFAQVNIGTIVPTVAQIGYDVTPSKSYVKISEIPMAFNVFTGLPEGNTTAVEFSTSELPANIPGGNLKVNGEESSYNWVAMNYVLVPEAVLEVYYEITTANGVVKNTINNVPVKKNHRTNIIGNLLTSNATYNIEILPGFEQPDVYNIEVVTVTSADDLQEVINGIEEGNTGNIKLDGDIDLGTLAGLVSSKANHDPAYGLLIPAGKSLVLDLNGCTLAQTVECTGSYSMIENLGNLTVIDSKGTGKVSFKDTSAGDPSFSWGSYTISNNGTLVVNGGTIEHTGEQNTSGSVVHMYCAIQQNNDNAVTTVNGGTVKNSTYRSIRICSGTANINGGDMIGQVWVQPFAEGIALNIAGGNFQPSGADGSSVFVTNNAKDVALAVTGGYFATKIGASVPANLAGSVIGGTYASSAKENTPADLYAGYMFVQDGENYILEECPVKVGESAHYATLAEAVKAVMEGETITIRAGKTLEEGTVKLPSTLKDVTFVGEEGATLKDMTVSAADGNSYNYEGLTFNGITFDNSRILLTGWRNGDETIKNLTVTNCIFKNLYDTTNSAPLHINKEAAEAVNGFVFTNNVIDGATGGSKSGIYAQLTGDILVSGNVINNVSFRPFVIQVTTDDNIADNFVVTNNTFSGSAAGRAQGLGNNAEGTDDVNVVVTENIFKGITESQQICYWNFNPATTTVDLSHNYYDINILANPGKIYFNSSAADKYDLMDMGVFPIYTDENKSATFSPDHVEALVNATEYSTFEAALEAAASGETVKLVSNIDLTAELQIPAGLTIDGNGKQINGSIYAGGDLTFVGYTKVTGFSASYYNRTITIGEGACLEVTGTGRVTLGYGNTFNITGNIADAKVADKNAVQPSLIIPGGISITGGNDATMNVTNAYVKMGNTSSKNSSANGKFNLNFTNSIAEFTNQLTFSAPTSGKNPTFNLNLQNSVLTTVAKFCVAAANTTVNLDNSTISTANNVHNSGTINLTNGSVLTGNTMQFGENGGNAGVISVDNSQLTINASSTGHAFDGQGTGSVTLTNGATANVTYYKDMTVNCDATSTFTGTEVK